MIEWHIERFPKGNFVSYFQMAFVEMDQDIPIKQEFVEEGEANFSVKEENVHSNPWLIENAKTYLKYCCPECRYSSKDVNDFSKHVSENHQSNNMFYKGNFATSIKEKSSKNNSSIKNLEKSEWGNCVVPNCTTLNSFGFFKFPKQQDKLILWLQMCGLQMVKKEDRICADHFKSIDFCLKPTAYPSLNLNHDNTDDHSMNNKNLETKGNEKRKFAYSFF